MGIILSGLRPTGKVHIGNYFGALQNWVKLQDEYKCFFEIADWHSLTTKYENTKDLRETILNTAKDWFSVGIDYNKSVVFVQSDVKEHAELHLLFSMLVTLQRLQRNPTVKEMVKDLHLGKNVSYGLLGYPVLQAADILIYRADKVPVGEDQLPHLELTREIARRFNYLFGSVFAEPDPLLTPAPRVPGVDGKRMSKSMNNAIFLTDDGRTVEKKVMQAFTDPVKIKRDDPGHPEGCVVFAYRKILDPEGSKEIKKECKAGKIGCVECKKETSRMLNAFLEPIRKKRQEVEALDITGILKDGAAKARKTASETMKLVREHMSLW
ncbi:tryptophan--tRNA ligase [candidate division WOR-3 bacterium]|nr:tryptophan--tRNA ligase [candidate division WOR-3 bacterium]